MRDARDNGARVYGCGVGGGLRVVGRQAVIKGARDIGKVVRRARLFDGQDKGCPRLHAFFAYVQACRARNNARNLCGECQRLSADDFDIARLQNDVRVWRTGVRRLWICEALGCVG